MRTKRKFLTTIIGALAYMTTSLRNSDAAFIFRGKIDEKIIKGIPKSWVDLKGKEVYDYAEFILNLNLKNITPRMVLEPHFKSRKGIKNELPPKKMWKKLKPTLKLLDEVVDETGMKVRSIVSAYRSPEYNRAVRGKSRSLHMYNNALDVSFSNTSPWRAAKVMRQYRSNKKFKGGIGTYSSFIHVDTRGENVDW